MPDERDKRLDPQWIMARLREMLAAYEHSLTHDGWHVLIRVTYRPSDGSGGAITFTVGTEPSDEDGRLEAE